MLRKRIGEKNTVIKEVEYKHPGWLQYYEAKCAIAQKGRNDFLMQEIFGNNLFTHTKPDHQELNSWGLNFTNENTSLPF